MCESAVEVCESEVEVGVSGSTSDSVVGDTDVNDQVTYVILSRDSVT